MPEFRGLLCGTLCTAQTKCLIVYLLTKPTARFSGNGM